MGLRLSDIDTEKLSAEEFCAFVNYAPPPTAVFQAKHQGWGVGEYLLANVVDSLNDLFWAKTEAAHDDPPHGRPDRIPRPGQQAEEPEQVMTIGQYMQLAGLEDH